MSGPVSFSEGGLKLGLAYKIAIFTVAIIFITSLAFNLVVKKRYETDERKHIESQVVSIAKLRAADWSKFLHGNQCGHIQEEIEVDVSAIREIRDVSVFDSRGNLVACGGGLIGKGRTDEWIKGAIASRIPARRWDGYTFRYFEPITHGSGMLIPLPGEDNIVGFISMEYNADHLRGHLARTRNYFIGLSGMLALFFTLIGVYFSRRLTEPIVSLTKASQRISEGDLSVTVRAKSGDEVGVLAENFNAMVGNLRSGIIERKAAEENVKAAKERLESFINNTSDGVGIIDAAGNVLQINSAFERIYGWSEDEIRGAKLPIIPEDRLAEFNGLIEKVRSGGSVTAHETKRRRRDGTIFDVSLTISAIRDEGGNVIAFAGITRDITERKKMMEELESSRERLRSLTEHLHSAREEERTRISREIHDELGQVLTALKMDLAWVNTKYGDHVSLAEKTALMLTLIDSTIKTVRRLCTELRPSILDNLGLNAAIEWQAWEFQKHSGIACRLSLDPENRPLDKDRATAVFRIFQEALTNVSRHASATEIRVEFKASDGEVVLTVRDNGRGISAEEMSKTQSFGLIGMRERVRSFGGQVKITGEKGVGTTVTVSIPVGEGETGRSL